jgi:DNA-binding transcriptional LysR family regulator
MPLARSRVATGSDGFRPSLRYDGTDVRGLAAAGHGLALLPESAVAGEIAVPIASPRLVHRTEVLHGGVPDGPAALLAHSMSINRR